MYFSLHVHEDVRAFDEADRLGYAREVIRGEAAALDRVAMRLDETFLHATELLFQCAGRIAITGTGKSADIAQKIAGTFNSTGTRSYCLDATRAVHGDLGMIHPDDVVMILSYSGESEEVVRLLEPIRSLAGGLIALTGQAESTLARGADVALLLGPLEEVCPLGLAPSTSTTAMIAVGDALAFVLSRMRRFSTEDFARYHPAGALGRKLAPVESVMRRGNEIRVASCDSNVRQVFAMARRTGRRTGAIVLTDTTGCLCGLFTDSDLARLFEMRRDEALDRPIREVMTTKPITLTVGSRVGQALEILHKHKISELPIVDAAGHPVGMIDVTDLIGSIDEEQHRALPRVA
jgi:arabinose-5-phosphate isomerase